MRSSGWWASAAAGLLALGAVLLAVLPVSDADGRMRVRVLAPRDGAQVSGAIPWRARVTGARAVRVDFLIDGRRRWRDHRRPYRYRTRGRLNTRALRDGPHALTVVARGRHGRSSRATVVVRVSNSGSAIPAAPLAAPAPSRATRPGLVTRSQGQLYLDGRPFRFTGMNIYNANSDGNCWYSMASGSGLDDSLGALAPGAQHRVIRAWFFQSLATTGGVRDWSAFDHTLAAARIAGARVIAVLGDQWGGCDPAGYKDSGWYERGYRERDPGGTVSYRDWVAEVARRYRGDPAILAWQLVNEGQVTDRQGDCPPNALGIFRTWAADVSAVLKTADPDHLVSVGTIGNGNCGAAGDEYADLHDLPTVDLCEYHDYAGDDPMPGDATNGLARRIQQCRGLDKPLFVGEMGLAVDRPGGLAGRANAFASKLQTQFSAGIAGALLWNWNLAGSNAAYEVGPGDPALAVLGRY